MFGVPVNERGCIVLFVLDPGTPARRLRLDLDLYLCMLRFYCNV